MTPDIDDLCPICGGPLLYSHGKRMCPSKLHETYEEEVNHELTDWDEKDLPPEEPDDTARD